MLDSAKTRVFREGFGPLVHQYHFDFNYGNLLFSFVRVNVLYDRSIKLCNVSAYLLDFLHQLIVLAKDSPHVFYSWGMTLY